MWPSSSAQHGFILLQKQQTVRHLGFYTTHPSWPPRSPARHRDPVRHTYIGYFICLMMIFHELNMQERGHDQFVLKNPVTSGQMFN